MEEQEKMTYLEFHCKFMGRLFYLNSGTYVDRFEVYATYITGGISCLELKKNTGWIKWKRKPGWMHKKQVKSEE